MDEIKSLKIQNQRLLNENKILKKQIDQFKNLCMNDIKKLSSTNLKKEVDELSEQKNILLNEIDNIKNDLNKSNDECAKEKQALRDEIEALKEILGMVPDRKRKRVETCIC